MDPARVSRDVPVQHLGQGLRRGRGCGGRLQFRCGNLRHGRGRAGCLGGQHRREQVTRGRGLAQHPLGQVQLEGLFQTQQQFGPTQAVEAQVAVEIAVESDMKPAPARWMELVH